MNTQLRKIQKASFPLLKRYGVKRAAVFGSYARGEEKRESDVDLLVEFHGKKSLLDLVGLEQELTAHLKKKVDVTTYRSLHPLLRTRILKERRTIYGKRP